MNNINISDYSNIKIENLKISVRLKNVLLQNGILYFNQLLECPNDDIQGFRNAGRKTLGEVIALKNNPEIVEKLLISTNETLSDYDKVKELEKKINPGFIDDVFSDYSFKEYKINPRLKNYLKSNNITSISLLLKTPIDVIKSIPKLGKKLLGEVINLKLKLLDVNNSKNKQDLLYLIIKRITEKEPKSVIYVKNYLSQNTSYNIENFMNDINDLRNLNMIDITMDGICIKKMSIIDYVNSIDDIKKKNIIKMRLNGSTLEEIGTKQGVTRERIRQILTKILENLPIVKEDKYKIIFEKYDFKEKEFCKIFNETKETYYYLNLVCTGGNLDIVSGLETEDFNNQQKRIIKKMRNIINIFGKDCTGSRNDIIRILSEEYAKEGITSEEFTQKYNNFVKEHPEIDIELCDERSLVAALSRQGNIVFDFGHKFRYLNMSNIDKNLIKKLGDTIKLDDGYYSTLIIFNDNLDLMKELDIRNEYELHSFLKRYQLDFANIRLDRMPNFSIGGIDKHDFTLNKIKELAPISVGDFLEFMENNYGHKSNTFLAYLSNEFSDFIKGNFIDSDEIEVDDKIILELRKIITEPIYSLDEVKNILFDNDYINIDEIITKNTMYKVGYRIRSSYILKKEYDSLEDYLIELANTNDFISNENTIGSSTYNIALKKVEKNYDIISISDNEFITITKLNKLGINKEMINKFCNDVYTSFENITYFTIYNVKDTLDTSWIDDNGFDDIFYECLVETIDNVKFLRINNQKIYSFVDDNVEVEDIINEFMIEESISLDELIDDIKEKYGIDVSYDKLIYSDKFYSKELNKLYSDKECYYKEVYNYE